LNKERLNEVKKNTLLSISFALALGGAQLSTIQAAPGQSANTPDASEESTGVSITGSVNNGDGVVTYDGEEVWKGEVTNGLRTMAEVIDEDGGEKEYAAAWDGDELLWENVSGAGEKLDGGENVKDPDGDDANRDDADDLAEKMKELMKGGASPEELKKMMSERMAEMMDRSSYPGGKDGDNSQNSTYGESINGKGLVRHNGEEVWKGRINGKLTVAGESIDADDEGGVAGHFAAAWDDDKLIWENYPGAGERLKQTFPDMNLGVDPKGRKKASRRKK